MTAELGTRPVRSATSPIDDSWWRRVGAVVIRNTGGTSRTPLLPVVGALAVIWLVFGLLDKNFLTADNLVNLSLQVSATGVIAIGVVLTLLVGQIDLSVGSLSGLAAAIAVVGTVHLGWPTWLAIVAALATGAVVGLLYGALAVRLRLPSFVFTLAGLLILAGVQQRVLGDTGTVNLPFADPLVRFSQKGFVPQPVAWLAAGLIVLTWAAVLVAERRRRHAAELASTSWWGIAARVGGLAAVLAAVVGYLGTDRGIGFSVVVFIGLALVVDVLLLRTRWGRAMRAVGGDRSAALRAGVPVQRTMVSAFVACSTFAALGGVLAAGRLAAANQGTGGGDLYLTAIAAAVIGGTSLYGGRGRAWSAVLGVLVIHSITNGLTLLEMDAWVRLVVVGAVLALALVIDSLARKRQS